MGLNKPSGNMYPWVTHTHTHLGGECPHRCSYCYVENPRWGRHPRYQGELRLVENEFKVKYRTGNTVFMENMNDLFADEVPDDFITRIIEHCHQWPENTFVFQTKNPGRYLSAPVSFPPDSILGCTIETNRDIPDSISKAPSPSRRMAAMEQVQGRKFITIEPVMDFDTGILAEWIARINPEFLNLGADSKNHHIPEPTVEKIIEFTERLAEYGIELREKHNLGRLKVGANLCADSCPGQRYRRA